MELITIIILSIVGFIASFIGVTVGGGGLLSIPALIFLGLPPQIAIATNKVGSLGIMSSIYRFNKSRMVNFKIGIPLALVSIVGAYIGATTLLTLPEEIIGKLIGIFILIVLVFVILNRNVGVEKREKQGKTKRYLGYLLFLFVGFWGGIFGGGYGVFATYVLIFMFGQTFLESAGTKKVLGLGISIVSVIVFAIGGIINWEYGIALLPGMALGSHFGADYGIKKGDKWVRTLFIIVVAVSAAKLILG